ncbi:vicianin hydrolase-like [Senna tora]|uniref:Vicianin hydrolase-like n=1 Tax=Senna tora TaxID=362788 RepID=A0A834TQ03_9FABA|nr:vicianin hydrolase-like [Senna tora]
MMRVESFPLIFFFLFFFFFLASGSESVKPTPYSMPFNRTLFPSGFVFGAGSAAYQTDIKLMKKIGLDSFRFSISWSRIFPKGKGKVNELGVKFYNNVIDELLSNGLTPFVTLFHWDLPQSLQDEYGGFMSPKIVEDFREYSDFCFKTFGDRVKNWVTLNEPLSFSSNGYNGGTFAPGRCSNYVGNCTAGNSATEPYIVGHHLILSHAAAVRLYKKKYQRHQKGQIGITLVTHWIEPKSDTVADRKAASRALDFWFGWYADPITYGSYPESMQSIVGDRLPKFTKAQKEFVKASYDFLGINYYTTYYATALNWLYIYPKGLRLLLKYVKDKYQNPIIYVTENGVAEANNASIPIKEAIKDSIRIRYYDGHLKSLLQAIKDGVKVKGYYAWSFFDDFEWDAGYTVRFGITYVDFKNNVKRYLKYSAYWLKMFLLH